MQRLPHRGLPARVSLRSADRAKARSISIANRARPTKPLFRLQWIASASTFIAGGLLVAQYQPLTTTELPSLSQTLPLSHTSDAISALDPDRLSEGSQHYLKEIPLRSLFRSYFVYLACQSQILIDLAPKVIDNLERARSSLPLGLGEISWRVFASVMRHTFFAQFVAGETVRDTLPYIAALHSKGCGAMLNWSAEAHEHPAHTIRGEIHILQQGFEELKTAVNILSKTSRSEELLSPHFLAVKLTGLISDSTVFERATLAIQASSTSARGQKGIRGEIAPPSPLLSGGDEEALTQLLDQLRVLSKLAKDSGVRLAFDAEQTWIQPALNRLIDILASEYNATQYLPIVFNTYQTNLRDTKEIIERDLAYARSAGYPLGIKLVRGAYIDAENARAKMYNCLPKVWSSKAETDECFDACAALIVDEIDDSLNTGKPGPSVIFASHNTRSIQRTLRALQAKDLLQERTDNTLQLDRRLQGRVTYSQLMSMAVDLTSNLNSLFSSHASVKAELPVNTLYLPYGQLDRVLPYLVRRAQENRSIMQGSGEPGTSGAAAHRRAIGRELRRRLLRSFHA